MRKYRDREEKERMTDYGILSLLPVAVVIVLVFFTKRTAVSLLVGTLVGACIFKWIYFIHPS